MDGVGPGVWELAGPPSLLPESIPLPGWAVSFQGGLGVSFEDPSPSKPGPRGVVQASALSESFQKCRFSGSAPDWLSQKT